MARTISISNQKGGVGKTTTAVNVAACLAVAENPVLLIDMDPQANTTSGLGIDAKKVRNSIYEVLINELDINEAVVRTELEWLDLLPSHIRLVGAELEMASSIAREKILQRALAKLKRRPYKYVFLDCPPSLGLLTLNALTAADSVLIPIQCEYYALEGLTQLLNTIRLVQKHLNTRLEIEGVLLTMYDGRLNLSRQVADDVRKYFGDKVYKTSILRNVRLSEAPSYGKPIILYDAVCSGADNYMNLATEIMKNGR